MNGEGAHTDWKKLVGKSRKIIYVLVVVAIVFFLVRLGATPWLIIEKHKFTYTAILVISSIGVFVQAGAYNASTPAEHPKVKFWNLLKIWSLSAVISVIAPFFAGIASRTTLLMKQGIPLRSCALVSGRQVWFGLEMALFIGGPTLLYSAWPYSKPLSVLFVVLWAAMFAFRKLLVGSQGGADLKRFRISPKLASIAEGLKPVSYLWFLSQIFCMGAIYYLGFNGFGANFPLVQSLALACITVVMSLIVFVPNGLGITDAIWIFIAIDSGLGIDHAAALAITFRMAHFMAAILLFLGCNLINFLHRRAIQ